MSSPLGHSLAVLTLYVLDKPAPERRARAPLWWLWPAWLALLGCIPDLDYLFPLLPVSSLSGLTLRGTHSLAFALALPLLTTLLLPFLARGRRWLTLGLQAISAGLSHLLLDFLVASRPMPLLYPWSNAGFGQPYHLLPSGGELTFGYLPTFQYLALEIGILVPVFAAILAVVYHVPFRPRTLALNLVLWSVFIATCITGFWLMR
jgi:membrane-bound metal-dependent hydrolase YbcI (DUF457 family)